MTIARRARSSASVENGPEDHSEGHEKTNVGIVQPLEGPSRGSPDETADREREADRDTEHGKNLRPLARELLEREREILHEMKTTAAASELRLGAPDSFVRSYLDLPLARWMRAHPGSRVRVKTGFSHQEVSDLESHAIDVGGVGQSAECLFSIETILQCVALGLGASVLPRRLMDRHPLRERVAIHRLPRKSAFAYDKVCLDSRAQSLLIQDIAKYF